MATAAPSAPRRTRVPQGRSSAARRAPSALRQRRPGGSERRRVGRPAPPRRTPRRRAPWPPAGALAGAVAAPVALLDRVLGGRVWVALFAVLLAGIVFLNVSLLELNGGIARTDARNAELRRENAELRMRVARLGSTERIQRAAGARGLVPAPPGRVGYSRPRPDDASRAAAALEDWPDAEPDAGPETPAR